MPSTGRHSYFNISNSNYKSLIDPQRLVEITAWNRAQTTKSAAIDHCWHRCNEGKKINKLLKIANSTFKLTDNRGFWYPWVETGGTRMEPKQFLQWKRCPMVQKFSESANPPLPALVLSTFLSQSTFLWLFYCHNPQSQFPTLFWGFERGHFCPEVKAVGKSVSV